MNVVKAIIAGNRGQEPELRCLPDGTSVTKFSAAVTDLPRRDAPTGAK